MSESPRKWYRLHWPSWLVFLVVTVAMVVIVVPGGCPAGDRDIFPEDPLIDLPSFSTAPGREFAREWTHGWPMTHLRRAVKMDQQSPLYKQSQPALILDDRFYVSWSVPLAWSTLSDRAVFSWSKLLVNLLVAAFLILCATATIETWTRRRDGVLRFRLIDLLIVTGCVAALLGWWISAKRTWDNEQAVFSSEAVEITADTIDGFDDYHGPRWLARLVGSEWNMRRFWRANGLYIEAGKMDKALWKRVSRMTHVKYVSIYAVDEETVKQLKEMPALRRLHVASYHFSEDHHNIPYNALGSMNQLELLEISSDAMPEDFAAFVPSRRLKTLILRDLLITSTQLDQLRQKYPRLGVTYGSRVYGESPPSPLGIAVERIRRWSKEDGITAPPRDFWSGSHLNLRGIRTSEARWNLLDDALSEAAGIRFGEVQLTPRMLLGIQNLTNLEHLRLSRTPATPELLNFLVDLSSLTQVSIEQGDATIHDFKRRMARRY